MSIRRWLERLSFSLFILAFALFWDGQKRFRAGDRGWRPPVEIGAAIACVIVGSIGVRLRHSPRPMDELRRDDE